MSTSFIKRNLKQTLTHWTVTPDGYGGFTFSAPTTYPCRWEDKNVRFISDTGEEVTSSSLVMMASELPTGDYIALGDHSLVVDPTTLDGAHRIKQINQVTDLRNTVTLYKAFL